MDRRLPLSIRLASVIGGQDVLIGPRIDRPAMTTMEQRTLRQDTPSSSVPSSRPASRDLEAQSSQSGRLSLSSTAIGSEKTVSAATLVNNVLPRDIAGTIINGSRLDRPDATCTWVDTTYLLVSEFVAVSTLSLPWTFRVLGIVTAIASILFNVGLHTVSSMVMWDFCLRHPGMRDICDIVALAGKGKGWVGRVANWVTSGYFYSVTIAIMAFHIIGGAEFIAVVAPTWNPYGCGSIFRQSIAMLACFLVSLVRTFKISSRLALASAVLTMASVFVVIGALNSQDRSTNDWFGQVSAWPKDNKPTHWMVAFLVQSFATNGVVTAATLIHDMKEPRDFPKALYCSSLIVVVCFILAGLGVYCIVGNAVPVPAFSAVHSNTMSIVAWCMMLGTLIYLGALYAQVLGRRVELSFPKCLAGDNLTGIKNTLHNWVRWFSVVLSLWLFSLMVAIFIPFFSGLSGIVASLFVSFFGAILPAVLWFQLRAADERHRINLRNSQWDFCCCLFWLFVFVFGVAIMFGYGSYAAVLHILEEYEGTSIGSPFQCRA